MKYQNLNQILNEIQGSSFDELFCGLVEVADKAEKSGKEQIAVFLKRISEQYLGDIDRASSIENWKKVDAFLFAHPLFLNSEASDFVNRDVFTWVKQCAERALLRKDFSFAPKLIVSFTSFPARIHTVYKTLSTIVNQTMKPYKILLYLAKSQFPDGDDELPESLKEYCCFGLEIRWVDEDIRPHKKYYYVMQEYPDALIVTIDDDLRYDPYLLETLFASYLHFPNAVSAVRTHLMCEEDGKLASYSKWKKEFSGVLGVPSYQLFSTSGAGTLYPPGCLDEEAFNLHNIKSLSLNADDLWLKVMQLRKGTPTVLACRNEKLKIVEGTQEVALQHGNVYQDANDVQLEKILDVYDPDRVLIVHALAEKYKVSTEKIGVDLSSENQYGLLECSDQSMKIRKQLTQTELELNKIKKSKFYRIFKMMVYIPDKIAKELREMKRYGGLFKYLTKKKK